MSTAAYRTAVLPVTACKQILRRSCALTEATSICRATCYIRRLSSEFFTHAFFHYPGRKRRTVFTDGKYRQRLRCSAVIGRKLWRNWSGWRADKDPGGWKSGRMLRFGRPPSHAVSSLTLISGTTLECRVIPTIRAGERRLLLRQGRSYLYDPGTCKCLRKFSGSARKKSFLAKTYTNCESFVSFLPIFSCYRSVIVRIFNL